MLGAVIPKDISICSVVEEIARQIDHFTRERARLCQCGTQESITQQLGRGGGEEEEFIRTRTIFATIFDVSESPIHRLSYVVPFVSIIIVAAEKSSGKVQGNNPVHLTSLKIEMLGKMPQARVLT